jgi:hypothetical protein
MLDQLGNLAPSIGWLDWTTLGKFWCADLWSREAAFDAWTRVLGWVITALATLFGAAFWFDALQQIIRLKGAGPSPAEKNQHRGAAA